MLAPDAPLVSINDHLVEPADVWTQRLPRSLADIAPRVVADGDDERWVVGGEILPVPALAVLGADGRSRPAATLAQMFPAVHDPVHRLTAMDDDGVSAQALLPHVIGFAGERLRFLDDQRAWEAAVVAYNDFLLQSFCAVDPRRLLGVAILPLGDIEASVRELTRVAGLGARAVSFPHDPPALGLPPLYGGRWRPVFAAAAEAGLPIFVHVGSSGSPPSLQGAASPGALLASTGLDVARAAIDLVFSATLSEHPQLDIVLLEGGGGLVPYLVERIDFFRHQRPESWPLAETRSTARLFADQVHASFIDDPLAVELRDHGAGTNLLWQSDFPHGDSYWPHSRTRLSALLASVPDEQAAAIAGGNARRLLGVDVTST